MALNIFGTTVWVVGDLSCPMPETARLLAVTGAPDNRPVEVLDARDLPPPQPLTETLQRLAELGTETVLVQLNDRAPQHLYPKLDDRGFTYDTAETADAVVTAIWRD